MRKLTAANEGAKTFTYQTRIKGDNAILDEFLQEYAALYGLVERKLFADFGRGKNILKLKNEYLIRYGITARQFNAIRISLQGKIESIKALQSDYIQDLVVRIKKVIVDIKKLQIKTNLTQRQGNKLHQKQRLLVSLKLKLRRLENAKKNNKVSICFGSKKLFKEQYNLEVNGLINHVQWQEHWRAARRSQFFVIGSKDESMGNQSCIATINEATKAISLKIRAPICLTAKYGKFLHIDNLQFAYGQAEILAAITSNITRSIYARKANVAVQPDFFKQFGRAINYRFLKDAKGWRVFVTCEMQAEQFISEKRLGAIGIDINIDHLAVTELDRNGNLQSCFKINTCTYGKGHNQAKAIIGDAVKQVVAYAATVCKPIVIEQLDFNRKKQDLAFNSNKKYNRQLSSFTYATIISNIKAKAFKHAIEVYQVNPAYTSVIGRIKFARIYKISVHQAAAMVIARRLFGFSERLPNHWNNIPDDTGGRVTLPALAKIPARHVWHAWARVRKNLQAALVAQLQMFTQFGHNQMDLTGGLAF